MAVAFPKKEKDVMARLRELISVFCSGFCCSVLHKILLNLSLVSLEHEGFFLITIKS